MFLGKNRVEKHFPDGNRKKFELLEIRVSKTTCIPNENKRIL